ncbi:MAG: hypothetical protein QG608_3512 [Actinomycetota bacterium]|nr:hypothetical protein [Actinomycetota bacterium]
MTGSEPRTERGRTPGTSRRATAPEGRRPDASMSLLLGAMEQPLDPGYLEAARLRGENGPPPSPHPVSWVVTAVVALLCGLLVTAAILHLRRPQPEAVSVRTELRKEIERRDARLDRQEQTVQELRSQIDRLQRSALGKDDADLQAKLNALSLVTGESPVRGSGLEIVMDDAPTDDAAVGTDPRDQEEADQGRVLDRDLQTVINGLWAAGAEAIAVNGQRLTALSAIRSAGQAILVGFRPLVPPYRIQAVGDPDVLHTRFADSSAGPYLQGLQTNYGIRAQLTARGRMTLPGASSLVLHAARLGDDRTSPSGAVSTDSLRKHPGREPGPGGEPTPRPSEVSP